MSNELSTSSALEGAVTIDRWLVERDRVVGQVKRLIYLWFLSDLGTHRECAKHLGCSHSTVTYHRTNLIKAGELDGEIDQTKITSKPGRISTKPVENSTPTYVTPVTTEIIPPNYVSNTEYREPVLASVTVVDDTAERDYEQALEHIDAIIKLTKKYFHQGWDDRKWYELAGECRTIEACCTNHCGSNFGAGSQRSGG